MFPVYLTASEPGKLELGAGGVTYFYFLSLGHKFASTHIALIQAFHSETPISGQTAHNVTLKINNCRPEITYFSFVLDLFQSTGI